MKRSSAHRHSCPGSAVPISPTLVVDAPLITTTLQVATTETPVVIGPTPGISNAPVQVYIIANSRAWMRIIVDGEIVFRGQGDARQRLYICRE